MTNKEFLTKVSLNDIDNEVIDYATEALHKVNENAVNRAAAKNAEDAPLIENVRTLLTTSGKVMTAAEIGSALGLHTSKVTALCKRIEGINVSDVQVDRRMVKGYSL